MRDARRKHDVAYACFLVPGLFCLINGIASHVTMDTGTAGGIGFLVLIPLALASVFAVPAGIINAVPFRQDPLLMLLVAATALMIVQFFAEVGSVPVRNLVGLLYGIIVIGIEAVWFLYRRNRVYAG